MLNRRVALFGVATFGLLLAVASLTWGLTPPTARGEDPEPPGFAILTEGGDPSAGLVEQIPPEFVAHYDVDLETAVAEETSSGVEVAVAPGEEGVCIITVTAVGCSSWVDAELGKLALVEACSLGLDPGEVRVTGLVPDPASTAVITRPPASGINVSAPLNVYVETFEGDPNEIASAGLDAPADLPWDGSDESLTTCVVPEEEQRVDSDVE